MKIVVLSDTHIPIAAKDLPQQVYDALKDAELIIHAGDMVSCEFYKKLQGFAEVKAVHGNMDDPEMKKLLPSKQIINIGKFSIGLIHGWGAPAGLLNIVEKEFTDQDPDIIIFGHSHQPINMHKKNTIFFNPGSPTDKIFANVNTYGIINITNGLKAEIVKIS